jgi:hypothetical protein
MRTCSPRRAARPFAGFIELLCREGPVLRFPLGYGGQTVTE